MAGNLYITEFGSIGTSVNAQNLNMGLQPPTAEQVVAFTTSTQSAAFKNNTIFVRLHADNICSVEFGTNPTATTSHARLAAGQTEYFAVPQGQAYKVAAVTNT